MDKTLHTKANQQFLKLLKSARTEAQLRQVDVAAQLKEPQSFVSKIESGERRLDVVELHQLCKVYGITLTEFAQRYETAVTRKAKT